jgi:iron complex outermembrane receptor protein
MNWKASTAALLCGCASIPAFAQDTPPSAAAVPAPVAGRVDKSVDIIVTAQRRNERLRDVPISITALTRETLEKTGVINTVDIARVTPGLQMTQYGLEVQPSIRGISSTGAGVGNSTNVAVYIDGVFQPNSASELIDLPDVDQIEVLKGPQGTYYGQNAAGGAIIIHSIEPAFKLQGKVSASYGNYNDLSFRGYVTGPISDTIAVEVAGGYEDKDAFRYNVATRNRGPGLKSRLIRGKILVKPSSNFSSLLTAYYGYRKDWDIFEGHDTGPQSLADALAAVQSLTIPVAHGPNQTAINREAFNMMKTWGVSLRNRFQTGIGELSTSTSYTKFTEVVHADVDYSSANLGFAIPDFVNKTFIQEVNFVSSRFSGFQIAAGLFFMDTKEAYSPFQVFYGNNAFPLSVYPAMPAPDFTLGVLGVQKKTSYAGYVEGNFDVTPALNISVGGRYSYESQRVGTFSYNSILPPPGAKPLPDQRGAFHFSNFSPRAVIRYRLNDRANVYASYSQGFKSGFVSSADAITTQCLNTTPPSCTGNPPVKNEKVTAYEIGFKGRVLDNLNINAAVFHYDWQNIQVFFYDPPIGFFQNAAKARINGVDIDFNLKINRELSLSGGGAYLDAKYVKYPGADAYVPDPLGFGYDHVPVNANGVRLPRTPKWAGNLALNYDTITPAGEFTAYASLAYQSRVLFDSAGITGSKAHTTVNGELGFSPSGVRGMRLVLWGKNLFNAHYIISNLQTAYALGGTYGAPRQFGGRIEFKF